MTAPSRRQLITAAAALGASLAVGERLLWAAGSEVRFDFTQPFEGWETVTGKWGIEDVPGASRGKALRASSSPMREIYWLTMSSSLPQGKAFASHSSGRSAWSFRTSRSGLT
jgi:hypothetical protein